jgi:polyisoprenoid-binding protein YceI
MKCCLSACVLAVVAMVAAPLSAAEVYNVSTEKSKIDFVGKKADGQHKGGFKKVSGAAHVDSDNPTASTIKLEIDAQSIWSDDDKLTDHLKNPDFFNVRKHPKITFESTKIERVSDEEAVIVGKLTMLEKTVETRVPVKVESADEESIVLLAKFKIDRTLWGMTYGEGKINKEVELDARLVFKR